MRRAEMPNGVHKYLLMTWRDDADTREIVGSDGLN